MSFYEWLLKHTNRNSPLGDLARDASHDEASSTIPNTREAWRNHLAKLSASKAAKATLETAWKSYQKAAK